MSVLRKKEYVGELLEHQRTIREKLRKGALTPEKAAFLMGAYSALERLDRDLYIFDWDFADTVLQCKNLLLQQGVQMPYSDVAVFADAGKYLVARRRGADAPFGPYSEPFGKGLEYSLRRLYRTPEEIEAAKEIMVKKMELELAGPFPYEAVRDLPNLWYYPENEQDEGPQENAEDEIRPLLA